MFLSLRKTLIFAISYTNIIGASALNDFIEKNDKNYTNGNETVCAQNIYNLQDETITSTNNANVSELNEILQIYETDVDFYSNFTIPPELLRNIEINSSQIYNVDNNLISCFNYNFIEEDDKLATTNVESNSIIPNEQNGMTFCDGIFDIPSRMNIDQNNNRNNLQDFTFGFASDVDNTNYKNLNIKKLNTNTFYLNDIQVNNSAQINEYTHDESDFIINPPVRSDNHSEIDCILSIPQNNYIHNKINCITEIPSRSEYQNQIDCTSETSPSDYNQNKINCITGIPSRSRYQNQIDYISGTSQSTFNQCKVESISKIPKIITEHSEFNFKSDIPKNIFDQSEINYIPYIPKSSYNQCENSYISDIPKNTNENNGIDYVTEIPNTNNSCIKNNPISNTLNFNNMYEKLEFTSGIQKDKNMDTTCFTFKNNTNNVNPLDIPIGKGNNADKSNISNVCMLKNTVVNRKVQDKTKNANQKCNLNEYVNQNMKCDKHVPAFNTKYSLRTRKNQPNNCHKYLIKKNQTKQKIFMYNSQYKLQSQSIENNDIKKQLIDGFHFDDTESLIYAAQKGEKLLKNKNNNKIIMDSYEKNTISNDKHNQNDGNLLGKRKMNIDENNQVKNIKLSCNNEYKDKYLNLFEKKLLTTNWNEIIKNCLIQRFIDKDKIISKEEEKVCIKDLSNSQYEIINESEYTDRPQTVIKHTQNESEEEHEKFETKNKTYCIGLYLLGIEHQIKEIYRDDFRLGKSDKKFIYHVDKNCILNLNTFLKYYRHFMKSQINNKGLSNYFRALSDTDEKFCAFKNLYSYYQTSINEIIYMINLGCITYNIFLEKLMRPNFKHKNLISMDVCILIDYFYALIEKLNKNLNHPIHKYLVELYFFQSYLVDNVKLINLTLFNEELLILIYFIYIFEYICDNIRHPNFQVTKNIAKKNHEKILNCPIRNIFLYIKLEIKRIFAHIIKLTVTQECIVQYINLIVIEEICNSYYTRKLILKDDDQNFNVYCKQFNLFFVTRLFFLLFGYNNMLLGLYDFKRAKLSTLYSIVAKLAPFELVLFCSRKIRVFKSLYILCYYVKHEQLAIDKTRLIVLNERIKKILLKYFISFPNNVNFEKDFENFIILNSLTSYTSNLYVHDEEMSSLFNEIFCIIKKEEKRFFYF
ncbi:hypothetical protein COBT_000594 [Conglomerata obtusa]